MLGTIGNAAPAVAVLAVFALTWGGVRGLAQGGEGTKPVLMLVCAAVLLGNVLIWTL